nr:Elongation factor G like [Ipomoea batatas]
MAIPGNEGSDLPVRSNEMKWEEKNGVDPWCRSKDLSRNNSFEVYYGGAPVGVPFRWESCPGTPRVKSRETRLPPLTPPPSFMSSPARKDAAKKQRKVNLLHSLLPKLTVKKSHLQLQSLPASSSPSSSSSSSSSSSPWSHSSHSAPGSPSARFPNTRPLPDSRDDDGNYESSVSSPCFCIGRTPKARSRGLSSNMLKLLFREYA